MADSAVMFDGVWKKFRRGERHDSLRDLIPSLAKRVFGRSRRDELEGEEFWAVQGVSFEVKPGEALGIIGPNGAGKSTVLKLLTRILRPTRGRCLVRGRVGALIEVAAGFHPDLTGRENIFLQGAIMGMKRAEIARKMDPIINFAGVSEFIDTPVKRYSSGMSARLGFSIAAHLDPEVLLIDEVLAVGDMIFQQRCVDRMLGFKREGVAIVFISHDLMAIRNICDRCILLQRGATVVEGEVGVAIDRYGAASQANARRDEPGKANIACLGLTVPSGKHAHALSPGDEVRLRVRLPAVAFSEDVCLVLRVHHYASQSVVHDTNFPLSTIGSEPASAATVEIRFQANLLRGTFSIEVGVVDPRLHKVVAWMDDAVTIGIVEHVSYRGVAHLDVQVRREADQVGALREADSPGAAMMESRAREVP